jgi:hypothetical protein
LAACSAVPAPLISALACESPSWKAISGFEENVHRDGDASCLQDAEARDHELRDVG